jgi:hypothetical protein
MTLLGAVISLTVAPFAFFLSLLDYLTGFMTTEM